MLFLNFKKSCKMSVRTSLSTLILQDFLKFRNSKKNVLKIVLIIVNINKDENK